MNTPQPPDTGARETDPLGNCECHGSRAIDGGLCSNCGKTKASDRATPRTDALRLLQRGFRENVGHRAEKEEALNLCDTLERELAEAKEREAAMDRLHQARMQECLEESEAQAKELADAKEKLSMWKLSSVCREKQLQIDAQSEEIERLRARLESIRNLALGPDKGSGAWQAQTAHEIATEALSASSGKRDLKAADAAGEGESIATELWKANERNPLISDAEAKEETTNTPAEEADRLTALGYRRTSRAFDIVSRIDRPDWKEFLASYHEGGMAWVESLGSGANDHYRRCFSKDRIKVLPAVACLVPGSSHDPAGFIDPNEPERKI